jgi:hypothetical protein
VSGDLAKAGKPWSWQDLSSIDRCRCTAEVMCKNISRSFRSPLKSCVCAIRVSLIRIARVLKGERTVEQTRGSLPLCRHVGTDLERTL